MRTQDIAINGFYAYNRGRWSGVSKVLVIDTGKYGTLSKWHTSLNKRVTSAIIESAGLPEDHTHFITEDENATVAIRHVHRDGTVGDTVSLVAARHIKSTWLEHEVADAEARAEAQRRAEQREQWTEQNLEDGRVFHDEVLRFAKAAEKARVLFEVKDRGFGDYSPVDAIGIVEVQNADRHGLGTSRSVTLNRQAVQRLTALLETLDVDPTTLWTVTEEVAA